MTRKITKNAPRTTMNAIFCRGWTFGTGEFPVRNFLYSADRAGITAEEPAEDKRQEEHNRKRDNADDEGTAEALHIPEYGCRNW